VICISRTLAAGGEGIGQAIADRLQFRYVDEQFILRAAQQAQVDPALVAAAEHRQPLLQRLVDKIATARDLAGPLSLATGLPLDALASSSGYRATPEELRGLIRAAIHELARHGRVVIVAHAASMALAGVNGVLRVLVTASAPTRAERLAAEQHMSAAKATAAIRASDKERQEYFRAFYRLTDELPTHYDLVINTDALTAQQAVDTIAAVAASGEPARA